MTNQTLSTVTRSDGRSHDQLRPLRFQNHIAPHASGSTLIEWGNTRVICAITIEDKVPRWMKEQGVSGGWLTSEYSMLPYSTLERKPRDISKGKLDGRSQEIQRLIGRALRACVDLEKVGPRTLWIDCDVLQADGGTRTAAITGSYVALGLAIQKLFANGELAANPLTSPVAAVSVGLVGGVACLDLNYIEDSTADLDMNLVMNAAGRWVEIQGTGENGTFSTEQFNQMLDIGKAGLMRLFELQSQALTQTP